ncbi:hypothetical protein AMAG_02175 [Allomyces macrogynus ATCC 38327]|uniref:Cryptic loci regulator 2 N-terminal domain-containing protein n=1 Tax=Allomyces macrogynus (strain ATCC 38327) TaxID=578462 RepID=A0A0L0S1W5_ALLM3|nr:hypothetical protein AMAG_02175 [Allomyces macrogynus ATCC 38327]|eukprot:KNE56354.1 hypothetical protein AMAG_02175 [Allomyces macrogynus ATCC 38327]
MASEQQGLAQDKEPAKARTLGGWVGAPAAAGMRVVQGARLSPPTSRTCRSSCCCCCCLRPSSPSTSTFCMRYRHDSPTDSDSRRSAASGGASRYGTMGTKRSGQAAAKNEPNQAAHELAASLTATLTLASTRSSPPATSRARAGSTPANPTRRPVDAAPRRAVQPRPAVVSGQQADDGDGAVRPQPQPRPAAAHRHLAVPAARAAPARPATPPPLSRRESPSTLRSTAGSPCQQLSPPVPSSTTSRAPAPAPASNSAMRAPPTFTDGVTLCWPAEIPGQIDRDYDHEARVAARLGLRGFPPGYAAIKRTKPSGRSDRYIYGHPSRRTFRSVVEFQPHAEWLLRVSSDPEAEKRDPCTCLVCHPENKVKKQNPAKPGKSASASAAASSSSSASATASGSAPTTPKKRKREAAVVSEPSSSASSPASTVSVPSVPPSLLTVPPPPVSSSHLAAPSRAAAARARALSKLPIGSRAIPKSSFRAPVLASDTLREELTEPPPTRQQHFGSGETWPPSFSQSATPASAPAAARQSRGLASLTGPSQGTSPDAGPQDAAEDSVPAAKKRRSESYLGFGVLATAQPPPPHSPSPEIDVVGVDSDDEARLRDVFAVNGRSARASGTSVLLEPPSPVAPPPPPDPARNALRAVQSGTVACRSSRSALGSGRERAVEALSSSAPLPPPPSRSVPRDPRLATTTRPGPYPIPPSRIVSSSTAQSTLSREQEERLRKSGNWGLKGGTAGRGTPPARPTPPTPGSANDPRQVQHAVWQRGAPRLVPYGLVYPGLAARAPPIVPAPGTYTAPPPPTAPAPGTDALPPPPIVPYYGIGHHAPAPMPPPTTTMTRAHAPALPPAPAAAAPTKSRNSQFQQVRRIYLGGPAGLQARRPVVVLPVSPTQPPQLVSSSRTRGPADQSLLQIPTSSATNPAPYPPAPPQRPAPAVRTKPSYPRAPISIVPEPTTTRAPVTAAHSLFASSNAQGTAAPVATVAIAKPRNEVAVPAAAIAKPTKARKCEVIIISDSEDDDQIDDNLAVASEEPVRKVDEVRAAKVETEGTRVGGAEIESAGADYSEHVKAAHAATPAAKEPARNDAGALAVNVERVEVARAAAQELDSDVPDPRVVGADNVAVAQTTAEDHISPRISSVAAPSDAPAPSQLHPPMPDVDPSSASEPATSPPPKRSAPAGTAWDDEASAESVPMTKAPVYDTRGVGSDEEDGDEWRSHHARRKRRKMKHEESQPSPGTDQENMTAQVDALLGQVDRLSLQGKPFPRFSLMQVCWMTLTKDEAREIDEEIIRDRKAQNQPWNDIVRKDPDAELPSDCDSDVDMANPEPWRDPKSGAARRHRRSHMWPVMVLSIYRPEYDPHEDELFMDSERVNEVDSVDPATLEYTVVKLPLTWYWRHLFALTEGLEDDADPRHFTTSRFYRFLVETAWQDFKDTDQLGGALDRTAPPMLDVPYEHHPPLRPIHQASFLHRVAASRLQHFRTLKERPSRAAPLWSSAVMQAIALDASWEVIEFDEEDEIGDFDDDDDDAEVEETATDESRARRSRTASAASGAATVPVPLRPPVAKEFYFLRLGSELITRGDDVWVIRNSRLPSGDYATPLEQLRREPTPTELPPSVVRMCTRREVEGMQRIMSGNDVAVDPIIMTTRVTDRDTIARVKLTTHTVTRFPPTEQRRPNLAYGMDRRLRMIDVVSTSVETRRERWGSRRITA